MSVPQISFTFRAILVWPYPDTRDRRSRWTFKAPWSDTTVRLRRELGYLGAADVIVGCGLRDQDIRQDGLPREGARVPAHPGVEISFTAIALPNRPRIVYATDVCEDWQHNVRSIALGLEALRAVDRYGITRRGEQYAGFMALPSGSGPDPERGRALVESAGGILAALQKHHPDHGGAARDFIDVRAFQKAVEG